MNYAKGSISSYNIIGFAELACNTKQNQTPHFYLKKAGARFLENLAKKSGRRFYYYPCRHSLNTERCNVIGCPLFYARFRLTTLLDLRKSHVTRTNLNESCRTLPESLYRRTFGDRNWDRGAQGNNWGVSENRQNT